MRWLQVNSGQCLRVRYCDSDCDLCQAACSRNAIELKDRVEVDANVCAECLRCTAVCPSAALEVDRYHVSRLIEKLKNVKNPVLACENQAELQAHEYTACLGYLSEEYLLGFALLLPQGITLNLTKCASCENSHIAPGLKESVGRLKKNIPSELSGRIRLAEDEESVNFVDQELDRLGFLKTFKELVKEGTGEIIATLEGDEKEEPAYFVKFLSLRRALLNKSLAALETANGNSAIREAILSNYYFSISTDEQCNLCAGCVGACPSGALDLKRVDRDDDGMIAENSWEEDDGAELLFNSSLCGGCGLCVEFCLERCMAVTRGLGLDRNPFEYRAVVEKAVPEAEEECGATVDAG